MVITKQSNLSYKKDLCNLKRKFNQYLNLESSKFLLPNDKLKKINYHTNDQWKVELSKNLLEKLIDNAKSDKRFNFLENNFYRNCLYGLKNLFKIDWWKKSEYKKMKTLKDFSIVDFLYFTYNYFVFDEALFTKDSNNSKHQILH